MTVTYTGEVATVRGFGCFLKLLFRWKGSIYKLVWPDLFLFLALYYVLNITYRVGLKDEQKRIFESVAEYCETYSNLIPLSFVLGFYVSIVMTRWWDQYNHIPWPDPIAVYVSAHIHGQDERGRLMRRTIMRYCCLCLTMVFTMISPRVKKRFPTSNHFVEAGLLLENEKLIISDLDEKFPGHPKHWLPIVWAASIVTRARKEGRIRDDFAVKTIIDELNKYRGSCGQLLNYDSISVPLVYTQVVTLAVYSFFGTCIMGRQWIDKPSSDGTVSARYRIDLYFPIFTMLQFFFYMGWLKVAESLINPFGEDDDDFEVNWLVDRNLQVSYLIVDEMHHEHPELIKDQYWEEVFPTELPYTIASEQFREKHPLPSTANIEISKHAAEIAVGSSYKDDLENQIVKFSYKSQGEDNVWKAVSVTNMLKSIFTRENSNPGNCEKGTNQSQGVGMGSSFGRLNQSQSTASLNRNSGVAGGTVKITDQVIEEVDEQLTVTSIPPRPSTERVHVKNIFPESKNCHSSSDPVEVPLVSFDNNERPVNISTSAPTHPFSDAWETLTSTGGKSDNLVIANHTSQRVYSTQRKKGKGKKRMVGIAMATSGKKE
ncbi:Bestrophin-1, putative [Pediculus humanus corporis]|uniref:Bestrophin homolog n=1 Tax=Pediculus humanus subsp. corporis TaxID=121224 RepID=E0V9F7_PEDHC|nr:Bestrophin-1, putative [Pediculus humanus corporis]EEB10013.1 Bestrophin-1, putative [Pediculus humanus corporis]